MLARILSLATGWQTLAIGAAAVAVLTGWLWMGWTGAASARDAAIAERAVVQAALDVSNATIAVMQQQAERQAVEYNAVLAKGQKVRTVVIRTQERVANVGTKQKLALACPGTAAGAAGLRDAISGGADQAHPTERQPGAADVPGAAASP